MATESISTSEAAYLGTVFADVLNYEATDVTAPIDPLTYRAPDGDTCLHIASLRGDVRAVELLLKAGVDVNAIGDMGCVPLHYATSTKVAEMLLEAGADSSIANELGNTPASQ